MERSETLFLFHITDGYSFRNAINIIKSETDYATMVLTPRSIEISFVNRSECAMHKITINAAELSRYIYNVRDENNKLLSEYPVGFETNALFNTTKGIGKRDGVRIYCLEGDDKFNVQPIKTSSKDPGRAGALFVPIHIMEYVKVDVENHYSDEPNVRVQAKDFADICIQANTLRAETLEILGDVNSVTFKSVLANKKIASINRFVSQIEIPREETSTADNMDEIDKLLQNIQSKGNFNRDGMISLNVVDEDGIANIHVPSGTYKPLSKIHNISPAGTQLKFFFEPNYPIKMDSPLSTYGTYKVYLRNPKR